MYLPNATMIRTPNHFLNCLVLHDIIMITINTNNIISVFMSKICCFQRFASQQLDRHIHITASIPEYILLMCLFCFVSQLIFITTDHSGTVTLIWMLFCSFWISIYMEISFVCKTLTIDWFNCNEFHIYWDDFWNLSCLLCKE